MKPVTFEFHVHHHDESAAGHVQLVQLLTQILQEIKKMPSVDDVKAAVQAAVDAVKQQIIDAVNAAVKAETAQVLAQIQAMPQAGSMTQGDLDSIVKSITDLPGNVNSTLASSVDSISAGDGLPDGAPPPPPPPPPPAG